MVSTGALLILAAVAGAGVGLGVAAVRQGLETVPFRFTQVGWLAAGVVGQAVAVPLGTGSTDDTRPATDSVSIPVERSQKLQITRAPDEPVATIGIDEHLGFEVCNDTDRPATLEIDTDLSPATWGGATNVDTVTVQPGDSGDFWVSIRAPEGTTVSETGTLRVVARTDDLVADSTVEIGVEHETDSAQRETCGVCGTPFGPGDEQCPLCSSTEMISSEGHPSADEAVDTEPQSPVPDAPGGEATEVGKLLAEYTDSWTPTDDGFRVQTPEGEQTVDSPEELAFVLQTYHDESERQSQSKPPRR
jgi:hypothetical protein